VAILPAFIQQSTTPHTPVQINFNWFSKERPHAEVIVRKLISSLTPADDL
jgi:hypothetical protein